MKVEIVESLSLATYVGIRATASFSTLGEYVDHAFRELWRRKEEIPNILDPNVTYGITPPNYKGNTGNVDFYCCFEVERMTQLPHGMVHIHILPRMYSLTHYIGPVSKTGTAYDYTSKWLNQHGYAYDDVAYYMERYDEETMREEDNVGSEVKIYCPVKRIVG